VKLAKHASEEQLWAGKKLLKGVQGTHLFLSSTARQSLWSRRDPSFVGYHVVVLVPGKVRQPSLSNLPCSHGERT
jgi:hypothetical protein